jgi:UDP-2,3-diacylglucosamine hydrolase
MTQIGNTKAAHSLLISDLHLCISRPHITAAFLRFLQITAIKAEALYILGDLFEYWAGDDDIDDDHHKPIVDAFKALAESGVNLYFMHGNRDFLISKDFCQAANITLLPDPSIIHLYGNTILLSHGDILCTDDVAYFAFREQVRNPQWQAEFLSQPLKARKDYIESIRNRSEQEKSHKSAQIMDVNADAVAHLLKENHYPPLLIHGHTHRPNQHALNINGHHITRWVLGDWYEQGSYLSVDKSGVHNCLIELSQ